MFFTLEDNLKSVLQKNNKKKTALRVTNYSLFTKSLIGATASSACRTYMCTSQNISNSLYSTIKGLAVSSKLAGLSSHLAKSATCSNRLSHTVPPNQGSATVSPTHTPLASYPTPSCTLTFILDEPKRVRQFGDSAPYGDRQASTS